MIRLSDTYGPSLRRIKRKLAVVRRAPRVAAPSILTTLWPILLNNHVFKISTQNSREMKAKFNVLVEKDENGYYVATVPSLPGCHTQAKSLDELIKRAKEAIESYLEVDNDIAPGEFVGVQVVEAETG